MPYKGAPSALEASLGRQHQPAARATAPVKYNPTLHQALPVKSHKGKRAAEAELERPAKRAAGPAERHEETYTIEYRPPYRVTATQETADLALDGEIGDGKPTRMLTDFTLYEKRDNGKRIVVPIWVLDNDIPRVLYASGYASPTSVHEGQDDEDEGEALYLDLDVVKQYIFNYEAVNAVLHIETEHAWYQLDVFRPSGIYRQHWQRFIRRAWACHKVITWAAGRRGQGTRNDFLATFAKQIDPFGVAFAADFLFEDAFIKQLELAVQEQDHYSTLVAAPLIRSILGNRVQYLQPRRKSRPAPTNPDLFYLDPRNQSQIHVTGRIAQLADGYFDETLRCVGRPPKSQSEREKQAQNEREREQLRLCIMQGNNNKKDVRRVGERSRTDFVEIIKIERVEYKVGDVVVLRPDTENLAEFPDILETTKPGTSIHDYFWFGKIIWMRPGDMHAHIQWLTHGALSVLDQLANPRSLYLLDQCQTIRLESVCGKIAVRFPGSDEEEAQFDYDCLFKYLPAHAAFVDMETEDLDIVKSEDAPHNCPSCKKIGDKKQAEFVTDVKRTVERDGHKATFNGFVYDAKEYHLDDFVLFRDIDDRASGPGKLGRIMRWDRPVRQHEPYRVTVQRLGRITDLKYLPDDVCNDERHIFITNDTYIINHTALIRVVFVKACEAASPSDDEEWLAASAYHWIATRKFPSISPRAWQDGRPIRDTDVPVCGKCAMEELERFKKLRTMLNDYKPLKTIELFAGIGAFGGGLKDGTQMLDVTHAVEISPSASETYRKIFPETKVYTQDTSECLKYWYRYWKARQEGRDVSEYWEFGAQQLHSGDPPPEPPNTKEDVDVIVAGFPCQTHSTLNMYKTEADKKSALILPTLSFVDLAQPTYCFFENVPGFLRYRLNASQNGIHRLKGGIDKGGLKFVLRALLDMDYQVRFCVMQSAHYGVPQRRERFFMVAAKTGFKLPEFPQPTHDYKGDNRSLRIDEIKGTRSEPTNIQQIDPKTDGVVAHPQVTIRDAIGDLPAFDYQHPRPNGMHRRERLEREVMGIPAKMAKRGEPIGWTRSRLYKHTPRTRFQMLARVPKGHRVFGQGDEMDEDEGEEQAEQRVGFNFTKPLDEKTIAQVIAVPLIAGSDYRGFEQKHQRFMASNPVSSNARAGFRKGMFGRLDGNGTFNTITTNIGPTAKQSKVLHPDEHRICTVREWARGQGLPDWYEFVAVDESVTTMHRHIGNAVPWQVSQALGRELLNTMLEEYEVESEVA